MIFGKDLQNQNALINDQLPLNRATRDIDEVVDEFGEVKIFKIEINKGRVQGNKLGQKITPCFACSCDLSPCFEGDMACFPECHD